MRGANQLIDDSNQLLKIAEHIQDEAIPLQEREAKLSELENTYNIWYRDALSLFDYLKQSGERQKFEKEYEGSFLSGKILKFLTSGLQANPLYIPDNPVCNCLGQSCLLW